MALFVFLEGKGGWERASPYVSNDPLLLAFWGSSSTPSSLKSFTQQNSSGKDSVFHRTQRGSLYQPPSTVLKSGRGTLKLSVSPDPPVVTWSSQDHLPIPAGAGGEGPRMGLRNTAFHGHVAAFSRLCLCCLCLSFFFFF